MIFNKMMIGKLKLDGYAALAPMAGVADRAMREMCIGFGAAYAVGELTSAKGVSLGDKKSKELLYVSDKERPMAVQLFGSQPDIMADAAKRALEYEPDFIDINMGCPAPKVAKSGGGCALMKTPQLAAEIVHAVQSAVDVPVTVKMRSGIDSEHINAVELARLCEQAGAHAITVHGRTREQMYAPPVNIDIIREVKQAVNIPVIGNGDIRDANDAAQMYEQTGCDFVMVGRAACGAPWIFSQINAYLSETRVLPAPPLSERLMILQRQVKLMVEYKGERIAMREARRHAAYYMRGLRGAASFRQDCSSLETYDDLKRLCANVYKAAAENE